MPRWLGLTSPAMSSTVSGTTPSHRDRKIKLLFPDRPLAGHGRVSEKEFLSGRKRAAAKPRPGTRTALYMRVSTADQKPDLQDDDLRGYAARAGLDVVQDYCDVAVSGRREGRPQLNALMAAARNHEIDCVLVWKFDRFARSTRHLLTALEEF